MENQYYSHRFQEHPTLGPFEPYMQSTAERGQIPTTHFNNAVVNEYTLGSHPVQFHEQPHNLENHDNLSSNPASLHLQYSTRKNILGEPRQPASVFPHVFKDPGINQSGLTDLIEEVYYLDIDSRDRDRVKWPTPHQYRVKFQGTSDDPDTSGKVYRNIKSVELISLCIPNTNNVLNEQYLLLQIDEVQNQKRRSANTNVDKAFTRLIFDNLPAINFLCLDKDTSSPLVSEFPQKDLLASLAQMTISFRKFDGSLFNFGADNAQNLPFKDEIQNSMTFKITELVRDTGRLGKRIV